jgi:NAD(P)-dependent dehydrogenase (short-subunit alcohol dehydrogenase family)
MDLGLSERIVFVTGGSQGIGHATARRFACEGARVALTYQREQARAEALVREILARNGDAVAVFLDFASPESIVGAVETVLSRWGRIDVLVNNAIQWSATRISQAPAFEDLPSTEWRPVLRANIEGVYSIIQSVVPSMREHGWGRILNVSSVIAEDGLPGSSWYSMVKSSLHGLTRTLSKELGPAGILINTVMPGLTHTERLDAIQPAVRRRVEESSPIRRVLTPDEVGTVIVFLASAANSAVTGEVVRIGGRPL